MKKVILNNGKNLEVAYCTNQVKFGEKTFTTPVLKVSIYDEREKEFFYKDWDMSDEKSIYGYIDGYSEELSFFAWIVGQAEAEDIHHLVLAIKAFDTRISEEMTNDEMADKIIYEYVSTYDDEVADILKEIKTNKVG